MNVGSVIRSNAIEKSRHIFEDTYPILDSCRTFGREHKKFLIRTFEVVLLTIAILFVGAKSYAALSVSSAPAHVTPVSALAEEASLRGVNIANNGHTYIQGARVTHISDSRLILLTKWEVGEFRWTIHINGDTRVILPSGELGGISDLRTGDFVSVAGFLAGHSNDLRLNADTVRLASGSTSEEPIVYLKDQ